jgi:hypothetical protein
MHLELAVEEGLVIPAFRYNCTSFSESLALIEEQGIQGVQEVPRIIAHRLDNAFEKNKTRKLINGANEISQVFAVRLLNGLKSFTMRASSQPIVEEVVITADFINKYGMKNEVIAAIENEHGELRRGAFYNILLSALNKISDSGKRIVHDSARDIFEHPACAFNPSARIAAHNLVALANATYHINMADSFGVGSYMPGRIYAPWAQPALVTATCVARDIPMERSLTSTEAKNEKLAITVSIPSVSQLRVVPWGELLKIRNDLGRGYFASIKAWHEEPDKYAGEVGSVDVSPQP